MRVASGHVLRLRSLCYTTAAAMPHATGGRAAQTLPSSTGLSLPNAQFVATANLNLHASRPSHVPTREANAQQLRKIQKSGVKGGGNGLGLRLDAHLTKPVRVTCHDDEEQASARR